jgi:hypothetical protein
MPTFSLPCAPATLAGPPSVPKECSPTARSLLATLVASLKFLISNFEFRNYYIQNLFKIQNSKFEIIHDECNEE